MVARVTSACRLISRSRRPAWGGSWAHRVSENARRSRDSVSVVVNRVERRLFNVIKHGDETAADLSQRLREDDPRLSFAAVLVTLVVIGGLVVLTGGALQ